MWTREILKRKAKAAFHANYWRCVLVALILAAVTYTGSSDSDDQTETVISTYETVGGTEDSLGQGGAAGQDNGGEWHGSGEDDNSTWEVISTGGFMRTAADMTSSAVTVSVPLTGRAVTVNLPFARTFLNWLPVPSVLFALLSGYVVLMLLLRIFVFNTLEIGCDRFFMLNDGEQASLREIIEGFKNGYWTKNCLIMLWRDVKLVLWTLLLVIPGIVKTYEYRMVPFILAEHPDMPSAEAFTASREMMYGEKWNAFVLDLSFILWHLLSAVTLGLAGIFYVSPYKYQTDAELYLELRSRGGAAYFGEGL